MGGEEVKIGIEEGEGREVEASVWRPDISECPPPFLQRPTQRLVSIDKIKRCALTKSDLAAWSTSSGRSTSPSGSFASTSPGGVDTNTPLGERFRRAQVL